MLVAQQSSALPAKLPGLGNLRICLLMSHLCFSQRRDGLPGQCDGGGGRRGGSREGSSGKVQLHLRPSPWAASPCCCLKALTACHCQCIGKAFPGPCSPCLNDLLPSLCHQAGLGATVGWKRLEVSNPWSGGSLLLGKGWMQSTSALRG